MAQIINPNKDQSWSVMVPGITVVGVTKEYKTYAEMLADPNPGAFGWVIDATGDTTVTKGGALYAFSEITRSWIKRYESEVMDQDLTSSSVGYYEDLAALQEAYPEGRQGWYALVGATGTFWMWNTTTESWTNTAPSSEEMAQLLAAMDLLNTRQSKFTPPYYDESIGDCALLSEGLPVVTWDGGVVEGSTLNFQVRSISAIAGDMVIRLESDGVVVSTHVLPVTDTWVMATVELDEPLTGMLRMRRMYDDERDTVRDTDTPVAVAVRLPSWKAAMPWNN